MPESPANPNEPATATRRAIKWDAVAAVIAALIGLLSLVVAGYTAYVQRYTANIQRQQVRAQVWPYLEMSYDNGHAQYDFSASNRGVGPLIVRSVQVFVAGRPVHDPTDLYRLVGFTNFDGVDISSLNQTVLAPGERIQWFAFTNKADVDTFVEDWTKFHVEAKVCYASTLGETWLLVFRPNSFSTPRSVSGCSKFTGSPQFQD